jgi:hypothetical protein
MEEKFGYNLWPVSTNFPVVWEDEERPEGKRNRLKRMASGGAGGDVNKCFGYLPKLNAATNKIHIKYV